LIKIILLRRLIVVQKPNDAIVGMIGLLLLGIWENSDVDLLAEKFDNPGKSRLTFLFRLPEDAYFPC